MDWKTFFKAFRNRDMLKRIGIVMGIVVIYRFIAHVPVPLAEPTALKDVVGRAFSNSELGGFLNLLVGGGLTGFSIVMVGISPYITASIVTQLITKIVPSLEELSNDGESGRRKINQWTRMLAVPLGIIQSITYIFILRQTVLSGAVATLDQTTPWQWVIAVSSMVAGTILLMWLGELITEQGVGNGISTIIFIGIVSQMPSILATLLAGLTDTSQGALNVFGWFTIPVNPMILTMVLLLAVLAIFITYGLVKINEAQRLVTINYAKRVHGNSKYGGVKSILPIRLLSAGVIPVIFAVAFLAIPGFVSQVIKSSGNPAWQGFATQLDLWFSNPKPSDFAAKGAVAFIYPVVYFILIVAFTYFYTGIALSPADISEGLQKQGGFINGVRPGAQTEKYLQRIITRLTLFGSLALGLIAITPFIIDALLYKLYGVENLNLTIGGTGALIIVTVALENLRQIGSRALMITYDDYK